MRDAVRDTACGAMHCAMCDEMYCVMCHAVRHTVRGAGETLPLDLARALLARRGESRHYAHQHACALHGAPHGAPDGALQVSPATTRINKPLLALTLVRLGFTPQRGRRLERRSRTPTSTFTLTLTLTATPTRTQASGDQQHTAPARRARASSTPGGQGQESQGGQGSTDAARGRSEQLRAMCTARALHVHCMRTARALHAHQVSVGSEGRVLLYCPRPTDTVRLQAGFSDTEVRSLPASRLQPCVSRLQPCVSRCAASG